MAELVWYAVLLNEVLFGSKSQTISVRVTPNDQEKTINISVNISGTDSKPYLINGRSVIMTIKELLKEQFNLLRWTAKINNSHYILLELSPPTCVINEVIEEGVCTGITIEIIKLSLGRVSLKVLVDNLQKQIRISSILNHEISWHLSVRDGLNIHYNCERESVHSIRYTPFKILSSLKHFVNEHNPQSKLKIYRGQSFTIRSYTVEPIGGERIEVDLKLYSCVSVIPSLRLSGGKKVPADRVCSELHINIYVTGNVPLYSTEEISATGFNIHDVADWTDYGLTVDETRSTSEGAARSSCSPFCFSYYLKTHRSCSLSVGRYKKDRLIVVFIFVELLPTTAPQSLSVEEKWFRSISLLTGLRSDFPSLLHEYSNEVHRTTHEGLNKIFCNYSDYGKITDSFSTSLPLLSGAVNDIHRLSVNNEFKKEVAELLETEKDVEQELLKKLNELSEKHSLNDRVPTTPELLVSMNEEISNNGTSETGINEIRITETRINRTETGINETETGINETETRINDVLFSDSECDFDTLAVVPDSDTIIGSIVPNTISLEGPHHLNHYEEEEGYDIDQWYDDTPAAVVSPVIQTGSVQTEPSCSSQCEKCLYDDEPDHLMEDVAMTVAPQINELDFQWSD